jgi:DNA polymerase-3 subunit epsilon
VLYVGKATNLRARVRSYFCGDERRKVSQLLRETQAIDHVVCAGTLEAAVLEVRLIHRHQPPFNRRSKMWDRYAYLKLTLDEPFPRLSVVRAPRANDGCLYLGPLSSTNTARLVAEAIESAVPIRRCTARVPKVPVAAPCAPAQLGVAVCPCAATVSKAEYADIVDRLVRGLTGEPSVVLDPLRARMAALASAERYEEAADVRDRAAALARTLGRQRQLDALRRAGRMELEVRGRRLVLSSGRLAGDDGQLDLLADDDEPSPDAPLPRHLVDELSCVASWLDAEAQSVRLVHCDQPWSMPVPRLPRFEPVKAGGQARRG